MQCERTFKQSKIDIDLSAEFNIKNESPLQCESSPSRWAQLRKKYSPPKPISHKVNEVMKELMDAKIISDSNMKFLKNENFIPDPTIVMNLRHDNIKRKHEVMANLNGCSKNLDVMTEARRIVQQERLEELCHKKEMEVIDREIDKFKKHLDQQKTKLMPKYQTAKLLNEPLGLDFMPKICNKYNTTSKEKKQPKLKDTKTKHKSLDSLDKKNKAVTFGRAVVIDDYNYNYPDSYDFDIEVNTNKLNSIVSNTCTRALDLIKNDSDVENIQCSVENHAVSSDENLVEKILAEENILNDILKEINDHDYEKVLPENEIEDNLNKTNDLIVDSISLKPVTQLMVTSLNLRHEIIPPDETRESKKINKLIVKKHFEEWRKYSQNRRVTKRIAEKQSAIKNEDGLYKIDKFLEKLKERKKDLNAFSRSTEKLQTCGVDARPKPRRKTISAPLQAQIQNKCKSQENVILIQKAKIEEQERIINDLKLKSITKEIKKSTEKACADAKHIIKVCNKNLKPSTICLQAEVQVLTREFEAPLQIISESMPQFLQTMNMRAVERAQKHKEACERREQRELMRQKEKDEAETSRRQADEESKRKRIEELKHKRRVEKLLVIKQEQERLMYIQQCEQADRHYKMCLYLKYGLRPFHLLLNIKYENIREAKRHYRHRLLKKIIRNWRCITVKAIEAKTCKAEQLNKFRIMRTSYNAWLKCHLENMSNIMVAEDWYNLKLSEIIFKNWHKTTKKMVQDRKARYEQAILHYNRQIMLHILDKWRLLPSLNQIARQREQRKEKWRHKVWEVLPDYNPQIEN